MIGHEIILSAGRRENRGTDVSFCNLSTVPVPNHLIYVNGKATALDLLTLKEAFEMATRIGIRQTCVEMPKENMSRVQLDERLIGVSSTGWRDVFDVLGLQTNSPEVKNILSLCKSWVEEEATRYSKELNIPRPLMTTTIKPEGTFSQVAGTSSGLHWDWSPYYIRRVRMSSGDPLAKTLIAQKFPASPELYDLEKWNEVYKNSSEMESFRLTKNKDTRSWIKKVFSAVRSVTPELPSLEATWKLLDNWEKLGVFNSLDKESKDAILFASNSVVFEFPVKSLAKVSQGQVSAIEQLENMKNFSEYYTAHMPSSTITVKEHEWDDVIKWVSENWSSYTTASFLPYYGGNYPLLPYEEITEEEYKERADSISHFSKKLMDNGRLSFIVDEALLQTYEIEMEDPDDTELSVSDCSKGCPIK